MSQFNGFTFADLYEELPNFIDRSTLIESFSNITCYQQIGGELQKAYQENLISLENLYGKLTYNESLIDKAYFHSNPLILLIGQYSSGKSTFVKYLIEKDYPGIQIGPEPTTDKFIAVMYGKQSSIIPGNALVIDQSKPFKDLIKFGSKFLNRFQASIVDADILQGLTIIDTPGILTDNNNSNGYDYKGIIQWFASRADRIFLFVDSNKLELSGDFQQIVQMIRDYDDKLRIFLNKTDHLDEHELIRIYGALMWFLGRTLNMKEVIQIYLGSFWHKSIESGSKRKLYEHDEHRIFEDMSNLPRETLLRKANLLVKRAQKVTIHASLTQELRLRYHKHGTRYFLGFNAQKKRVMKKCEVIYRYLESEKILSKNDFPDIIELRAQLRKLNWRKLPNIDRSLMDKKNKLVNEIIPKLIAIINAAKIKPMFEDIDNVFAFDKNGGLDEGLFEQNIIWIVDKYRHQWTDTFMELCDGNNKISALKSKAFLLKTNLPSKVLSKIWKLADIDGDEMLDLEEFLLLMYIVGIKMKKSETLIPEILPKYLIPPSKRHL